MSVLEAVAVFQIGMWATLFGYAFAYAPLARHHRWSPYRGFVYELDMA